jgi:hypothetical protein
VLCATGVFLALLGLYFLTAPGRIDVGDGQFRYEVAKNWLDRGEPLVADRYLLPTVVGHRFDPKTGKTFSLYHAAGVVITVPQTGKSYTPYNAAPSVVAMPLMLLSRVLPGQHVERDHFAFSLTGPLFGALLGALLIFGYGLLGIRLRESLIYTAIFCLATLWWPASVTVFDQNQHAVLLLGSVLLAWLSAGRKSMPLAALAGLLGGLLLNYQESYALLLPVAGLAVLASPEEGSPGDGATLRRSPDRAALLRYLTFGFCCCVGLRLFFAFNEIRFGTPLMLSRYGDQDAFRPPTWGNPVAGFLGLAISPGKGLFWFSPPLLLTCLGARRFFHRAPVLAVTVAGVSMCYLLVIIHLAFFGGDWCWGPRYVIPVMPLWALAFPFASAPFRHPRRLMVPLVLAGLLVQLLGISVETQRFFYERNLPASFWAFDPWFYFKDSQLMARPLEILASLEGTLPRAPMRFTPSPTQPTYSLFSPLDPSISRLWVQHFQVFYLPRPWWGWFGRIAPEKRPVDFATFLILCAGFMASGGSLLLVSLRTRLSQASPVPECRDPAQGPKAARLELAVERTNHE